MIKEFYEYLLKGATKEQLVTYVEKLQAENEELKAQLDKATTAPVSVTETRSESFYVNGKPVSKEAYEAAEKRFSDAFDASPLIPFF